MREGFVNLGLERKDFVSTAVILESIPMGIEDNPELAKDIVAGVALEVSRLISAEQLEQAIKLAVGDSVVFGRKRVCRRISCVDFAVC